MKEEHVAHFWSRETLIVLSPLILYLIGLNPYFAPNTFDSIVYFEGAISIANGHGYGFMDDPIIDWPPLFSYILAIPITLGISSVFAAKVVVMLFVAVSLLALHRLLQVEQRPYPTLTCFIFGILPTSLILGTQLLTEWSYVSWSALFLLFIKEQDYKKSLFAGVLLGCALLTRYMGLLLLIPLTIEKYQQWKEDKTRRSIGFQYFTTIGLGFGLFSVVWLIPMVYSRLGGAKSQYYNSIDFLKKFNPWKIAEMSFDTLIIPPTILEPLLGISPWNVLIIAIIASFVAVISYGFWISIKQRRCRSTDLYVLVLVSLLTFHEIKATRYIFPITPFLIGYLLNGIRGLPFYSHAKLMTGWIGCLLFFDAMFLFVGNKSAYNGSSLIASPSVEQYYRGSWLNLYKIGQKINELDPPDKIGLIGDVSPKYLLIFSGHSSCNMQECKSIPSFVVSRDPEPSLPERIFLEEQYQLIDKEDEFTLYGRKSAY